MMRGLEAEARRPGDDPLAVHRCPGLVSESDVVAHFTTKGEERPQMDGAPDVGSARGGIERLAKGADDAAGDRRPGAQ